jgi:GH15 family glucan-1,4-alpha-glucosidase
MVLPTAEYGLIGDCHTAALVSRAGAIDWCCMPRFDSGSCFGRLLGPGGGTCVVAVAPDQAPDEPPAREYLEGTLVLATTLQSAGGEARLTDCLAVDEAGDHSDRRLLLRVIDGVRGAVPLRIQVEPRFDYGEVEPWIRHHGTGLYSATGGNDALLCWSDVPLEAAGPGTLAATATVRGGERVRLALAYRRPEELEGPLEPFEPAALDRALDRTVSFWRRWSRRMRFDGTDVEGARRSALTLKALSVRDAVPGMAAPGPTGTAYAIGIACGFGALALGAAGGRPWSSVRVPALAHRLRDLQSGRANDYVAWLAVGTAALMLVLVLGTRG